VLGRVRKSVAAGVHNITDGARRVTTRDARDSSPAGSGGGGVNLGDEPGEGGEDDHSSGSDFEEGDVPLDPEEQLKQMDRIRIMHLVYQMNSPNMYYKGLTTFDFHAAILNLLDMPPEDIRLWLDLFERQWRQERVFARELEGQAGLRKHQPVQATGGPADEDEEIAFKQPAAVMRWMALLLRLSGGGSGAGRAELLRVRDVEQMRGQRLQRTRQDLQTMLELHREWREAEEKKRKFVEEQLQVLEYVRDTSRFEAMGQEEKEAQMLANASEAAAQVRAEATRRSSVAQGSPEEAEYLEDEEEEYG